MSATILQAVGVDSRPLKVRQKAVLSCTVVVPQAHCSHCIVATSWSLGVVLPLLDTTSIDNLGGDDRVQSLPGCEENTLRTGVRQRESERESEWSTICIIVQLVDAAHCQFKVRP
jgi:hypothetical protein